MKSKNPCELKLEIQNELEPFFYPRSVAMIGASQNPLKPNGIPLYLMSMFGYQGKLYPVNPKYDRVGGLQCYPSILDIEESVDLAIIGVAADRTMEVLEECARKRVKAAIIFTSGFAEVNEEGRKVQEEMKKLAESSSMRILGPNCLGILNYYNGNMASFFYNQERADLVYPEKLSFITQSGGLGGIIYQMVVQMSIGFNYFISTGNEADISFAEVLSYLVGRDEVSIVAGYMEGLQGDGKLFIDACRQAFEQGKLVTVLKVGRTGSGAMAAASHTGAMVGEDRVYDGVFKQYGVPRADDVEQMNALIALHATGRLPAGKRMAVITISGGGGVVVADKCPYYGLEVVRLAEKTQAALRTFFPSYGAVANPVDLTSQIFFDNELFERALHLVMKDPEIDVAGFFYNFEMPDPEASKKIIKAYNETEKPLVIFTWPTSQDYAVEAKNELIQAGVPVIEHIPSGLWAISSLAEWVEKAGKPLTSPEPASQDENKTFYKLDQHLFEAGEALTEWRSKEILKDYAIPVTREVLANTDDEAITAAKDIGFPVALKIMSPQMLHKSDFGGIVLNLKDEKEVRDAYEELVKKGLQLKPKAQIEGILVQEMLDPGLEVIVGIKKDPVFGQAIAVGLGGVFVELFEDLSTRVAPLRTGDAEAMLDELKGNALLKGARGQKPKDRKALVDTIMKISRLAVELEEYIEELDINPLVVYEEGRGVVAADALISGVRSRSRRS